MKKFINRFLTSIFVGLFFFALLYMIGAGSNLNKYERLEKQAIANADKVVAAPLNTNPKKSGATVSYNLLKTQASAPTLEEACTVYVDGVRYDLPVSYEELCRHYKPKNYGRMGGYVVFFLDEDYHVVLRANFEGEDIEKAKMTSFAILGNDAGEVIWAGVSLNDEHCIPDEINEMLGGNMYDDFTYDLDNGEVLSVAVQPCDDRKVINWRIKSDEEYP